MKLKLAETKAGVRSSTTRLPFRYGKACLTRCPQLLFEARVETPAGESYGYSADCLPPSWFDKRSKSYGQQLEDLRRLIQDAQSAFALGFANPRAFQPTWLEIQEEFHKAPNHSDDTALAKSFALSLVERAMIDATCRAIGITLHEMLTRNLLELNGGAIHSDLQSTEPRDWIADSPSKSIWVRHTVGLADPLTPADLASSEQATLDDPWPKTLEDYLKTSGIRYLKIKVSNQLDNDVDRLRTIAQLMACHEDTNWTVTLDGNEQYNNGSELAELVDQCRSNKELHPIWSNTLWIEQPFERSVALDTGVAAFLSSIGDELPVLIDESDGELHSFQNAMDVGYRGTSVKSCKGLIKAVLNAGLVRHRNKGTRSKQYFLSAEDLCCVGPVAVQSDLCTAATLGITHAERNGHHFHPGLTYLPDSEQQQALHNHSDLYESVGDVVAPRLSNGQFDIGSLMSVGTGFKNAPSLEHYTNLNEWNIQQWEETP